MKKNTHTQARPRVVSAYALCPTCFTGSISVDHDVGAQVELKAKFESGSSYFSVNR